MASVLGKFTAGLNEPLKPAPQAFAADYQVPVRKFDCTFAQQFNQTFEDTIHDMFKMMAQSSYQRSTALNMSLAAIDIVNINLKVLGCQNGNRIS